jgi:hypothetical protein
MARQFNNAILSKFRRKLKNYHRLFSFSIMLQKEVYYKALEGSKVQKLMHLDLR